MALAETIVTWVMDQLVDRTFSSAIEQIRELSFSNSEINSIEKIRQIFFQKYCNEPYYNDLDNYITQNKCIEVAVRFAGSAISKEQRSFSQFADYNCQKFLELYSRQKHHKNSIKGVFELIRQTAIIEVNLSSDLETRKLQVSLVQKTEEIKNDIESSYKRLDKKIEQLPLQIANISYEAYKCEDHELQPFFDKIEYIKENFQKNQKYNAAIQEYNSCYQTVATQFQFKTSDGLKNLNCRLLCNIAICYANMGYFESARKSLQTAIGISLNKTVRNTYCAIALQTMDSKMYEQAILFMKTNLKENPDDIESFLFFQIFSVLCDEKNFEHVIGEMNSKKSIIKEQSMFEKYFEFKALIERLCGDFEQAIHDFEIALEYGYDKAVAQFNIASVFYSIATKDNGSGFHLNLKIKWDKLLVCHTMLIKLLSNLPSNDLKYLLLPDILKLHLNCCMLLEKNNNVYLQQDLVTAVWDLDYDSIRSFILTTPNDVVKQNNYVAKLNESDSAVWNIHQKIDLCNYAEAEAIASSGLQRELFPHPVLIYDILLQISLNQSDCKKYIMYRDQMIAEGLISPSYQMMEACYAELSGQIEEAKSRIDTLLLSNRGFSNLENAIKFYRRNKFESDALKTIRLILEYKKSGIIYVSHADTYYRSIFEFVLNNDFELCNEIVEHIDIDEISEELLSQLQLDVASYKNDLPRISMLNKKLFDLTQDSRYLINSASAKLNMGDYVLAEEILQSLSYSKLDQDERWHYNLLYSKIELLKSSYEKAFEYAQLAHQDNLDRPKHPSHSYYLSVATRCGHLSEGLRDTLLFKKENPVVVDYIKEIPSIETDESGNKFLSQEFQDFLTEQQKAQEMRQRFYREGHLGIYQIANFETGADYANLVSQFFSSNGEKLKIFCGDLRILNSEVDLLKRTSSITVDALSLVLLAQFDLLNLLNPYKSIYVGYSTFTYIQECLVSYGISSKIYKAIYDWINQSPNCIKYPDGPIAFEDEVKSIFPIHLLGSVNVAHQKDIPLLYGDLLEAALFRKMGNQFGTAISLVSINSLVNAMEDTDQARRIRCQLMQYVSFINFSAEDILYWIDSNHEVSAAVIARFLTCSSNVDVMSFAGVYRATLIQLKNINPAWAKSFALELIINTEKLRKKVTYYELTIESVLRGKIDRTLPYVKEHVKKYRTIIEYTVVIIELIQQLFSEDQEICEKLKSIDSHHTLVLYSLSSRI